MKGRTILRISVIALCVLMLVIGILRDEARMVLMKGTDICLSCVGIG